MRQRKSSYQGTAGEAPLVPDNFDLSGVKSYSKQKGNSKRPRCKMYLIALLSVVLLYMGFTMLYAITHTADPCDVGAAMKIASRQPSTRNSNWREGIPKIIHQQWKGTTIQNEKYNEWRAKWKAIFSEPTFEHILWTDETQLKLIEDHYPFFLEYYKNYQFGIQRADAARYFILFHYGGIYADLDYEPLENFWEYLPNDRVGLIESPYQYNEKVQNSMMSSPQKDAFWEHSFVVLMEDHEKPVLASTGPVFLDKVIGTNKEPYAKLPCEIFHRIPLGELKESPFLTLLHRELLGRIYPMKQCGNYDDMKCQVGRHHNTATYINDTGLLGLLGIPYDFLDKVLLPVGMVVLFLVGAIIWMLTKKRRTL